MKSAADENRFLLCCEAILRFCSTSLVAPTIGGEKITCWGFYCQRWSGMLLASVKGSLCICTGAKCCYARDV